MNNSKFNDRYNLGKKPRENATTLTTKPKINQNNNQKNVSTYEMTQNKQMQNAADKSIIDISDEKLDLTVEKKYFQKDKLLPILRTTSCLFLIEI
jgi:hypothetical protein